MTRWTDHVKEFAKKKGIGYGCALSDPDVKKGYVPAGDKKRKPEKLEQAMPSTEPKEKGIVIKPRPEPVKPKPMKGSAAYEKERTELITKKFLKKDIVIKPKAKAEDALFEGMNEKEIALTKAYRKYYEEKDNDFERYVKVNKRGEITGDNKAELKRLTNDLASEFNLPQTWLKQADKIAEKYGLNYGSKGFTRSK